MALIDEIRQKFEADEVEFTKHAAVRSLTRNIAIPEIREAIAIARRIVSISEHGAWVAIKS